MMIASQPLEVQPNRCHVCGSEVKTESSDGDTGMRRVLAVDICCGLPGKTRATST